MGEAASVPNRGLLISTIVLRLSLCLNTLLHQPISCAAVLLSAWASGHVLHVVLNVVSAWRNVDLAHSCSSSLNGCVTMTIVIPILAIDVLAMANSHLIHCLNSPKGCRVL